MVFATPRRPATSNCPIPKVLINGTLAKSHCSDFSGLTRYIAAFRGKTPVFAICYREKTVRQLALSYGVFPIFQEIRKTTRIYLVAALKMLIQRSLLKCEDTIIYLSSSFGVAGGTTFLEINKVDTIINNADHFLLPNFPSEE